MIRGVFVLYFKEIFKDGVFGFVYYFGVLVLIRLFIDVFFKFESVLFCVRFCGCYRSC